MERKGAYALAAMGALIISFILIFVCSSGGKWSASDDPPVNFGLTEATAGGSIVAHYSNKDQWPASSHSDVGKVESAGKGVTAFLILSMLVGVPLLLVTLLVYPFAFYPHLKRYLPWLAGVFVFFTLLPFAIWSGSGHNAIRSIKVYHRASLSTDFTVAVFVWIFAILGSTFALLALKEDRDEGYTEASDFSAPSQSGGAADPYQGAV